MNIIEYTIDHKDDNIYAAEDCCLEADVDLTGFNATGFVINSADILDRSTAATPGPVPEADFALLLRL